MSIIIRLQNLPWEANSLDIRRFFHALTIPDGGVHIVGGEKGDAFIAFANDEDARQAMARDGQKIKDSPVKLLLSSRNEMQRVIELARTQSLALKAADQLPARPPAPPAPRPPMPAAPPGHVPLPLHQKNGSTPDTFDRRSPADRRPPMAPVDAPAGQRMARDRSRSPIRRAPMSGIVQIGNGADSHNQQWTRNQGNFQPRPPPPLGQPPHLPPGALPLAGNLLNGGSRPPLPNINSGIRAEVRNLPFNVSIRDIQEFLKTVSLYLPEDNIKILVDERGFQTGAAIIRLASDTELEAALSANGRFMADRRIEVTPLLDNLNNLPPKPVVLPVHPAQDPQRDYVVYMKGSK